MTGLKTMAAIVAAVVVGCAVQARAQLDFEGPPIDYAKRPGTDRVAQLAKALEGGTLELKEDEKFGLLPAVLEALDIPIDSQTLVFSKTSFQLHKISPGRPRALYFNDDTYVGWVQGSDIIELAATDKEQGAMFYTIEPNALGQSRVLRDQGQCLICHASSRTQGVPGFVVRSVYSTPAGRFVSGSPTFVTDHSSPFEQRWGGWYVTGTHGEMRHLGNVTCTDESRPGWIDPDEGANLTRLPGRVRSGAYLTEDSDLVALMVLEHQTQMHNWITRAGYEARTAAYQDRGINEALDRPLDYESESTGRRIASIGEKLVRYLLMADEFPLGSPVRGTSSFAETFSKRGPHDAKGRSLYQLDLEKRLFKYPCSFLIYSEQFEALPERVKSFIGQRLHTILLGDQPVKGYEKLADEDRRAIAEILAETKPDFWETHVRPVAE
ncbi:MAG: hypothetical protein ACTHOU_05555 [Aureliella sp.]